MLIISEYNFGKNLIATAYLNDLGSEYFNIECAGLVERPLDPLVLIIMKLEGYDLSKCDSPYSVFELFELGRRYDIVITICPKRIDEKCPHFPGTLLRLNWRHSDPDKIVESRIDRLQQTRILRDSIKEDVKNFLNDFQKEKWDALK